MQAIERFERQYRFLSNFYPSPFLGPVGWKLGVTTMLTYPTAEHYYQASKSNDPAAIALFLEAAGTPGQAKRLGRRIQARPDWEAVKLNVMRSALYRKFRAGTELADRLLATGDVLLVEGNTWGDKFWGVCGTEGYNWLGHLLMAQRAYLRSTLPEGPEAQASLF